MPRLSTLASLHVRIERLGLEQLKQLYEWLGQLIQEREAEQNNVLDSKQIGQSSFQLEAIKCGNPTCKCAGGKLHGPYWYEYWRDDGKVKKRYHGKRIRQEGAIAPEGRTKV